MRILGEAKPGIIYRKLLQFFINTPFLVLKSCERSHTWDVLTKRVLPSSPLKVYTTHVSTLKMTTASFK